MNHELKKMLTENKIKLFKNIPRKIIFSDFKNHLYY